MLFRPLVGSIWMLFRGRMGVGLTQEGVVVPDQYDGWGGLCRGLVVVLILDLNVVWLWWLLWWWRKNNEDTDMA